MINSTNIKVPANATVEITAHNSKLGLVLCHIPDNDFHQWVVWAIGPDGHTYAGSYCKTEEEARKEFFRRLPNKV